MDQAPESTLAEQAASLAALLEGLLGQPVEAPELLAQALVHSSALQEAPLAGLEHNERLEFLGDAVLQFAVTEALYTRFPGLSEGALSKIRATLVRTGTLAKVAKRWGLDALLLCGATAKRGAGPLPRPLAGLVEAVLGAVYLQLGCTPARFLVTQLLAEELSQAGTAGLFYDFKSRYQQVCQQRHRQMPVYQVTAASGPAHEPWFQVEVLLGGARKGCGEGRSKKQAEQEAAREALIAEGMLDDSPGY